MSSFLRLWLALLLTATGGMAQNAPVPKSGNWTIDARLSAPMVRSVNDQEPIRFQVNPCGDRIDVYNPNLVGGTLPLIWVPVLGQYKGEGSFMGGGMTGTVSFVLSPETRTRMSGNMSFFAPGMIPQPWTVTIAASGEAGGPNGYGDLRQGNTSERRRGALVTRTDIYSLVLSQFERGSAALLPGHYPAIDQAASLLPQQGQPGNGFCYSETALNVEGFADPRLETGQWIGIARDRAGNTMDALRQRGFPLGNISINQDHDYTGAPGRGTDACKRAAVATFAIAKTRIEPIPPEELENWMLDWLATAGDHPDNEVELQTRIAKARYCFAAGISEAVANGACPDRHSDVYEALEATGDGLRTSIESIFSSLPTYGVVSVTPGDQAASMSDMQLGTQVNCSEAARAEADRLELGVLRTRTDWGGRDD